MSNCNFISHKSYVGYVISVRDLFCFASQAHMTEKNVAFSFYRNLSLFLCEYTRKTTCSPQFSNNIFEE